jgi:N-acyl-D-aspartate/D-glutamate deacylase
MLSRLASKEDRERIKTDLRSDVPGWDNFVKGAGYAHILICSSVKDQSMVGKTLQAIADGQGKAPDEALLDLLLDEKGENTVVIDSQSEYDNENIMKHPLAMIGSDSIPTSMTGRIATGMPHPRCFGTFPHALGHFSRERGLFPLETAIWKMTGFPAWRYGLDGRGLIKKGFVADFVVFDPKTIEGSADYLKPRQVPKGLDLVIKNGVAVVENGRYLGQKLGKTIRRI